MHYFNDNQEIRDISVKRMEDLEREKEVEVRIGVAGILEDANAQLQHGLTANFGVRNAGLPAVFQSDIDVSDGEMLKSTLENARNEITNKVDEIPTTLFRCIAKKQAPVIEWNITKKIAKSLWEDISVSRGSNITSIRNRKAAATALLLAHTSGGRWIDIHRMKWEDLKFKKTIDTMYVQAPLRFSKNNLTNNVPQALQWASSVSTDKSDCPWTIFRRWWIWCGRPTKGFVFANGAGKMLSGNSTIYHVQAHARKLNLPDHQIPRKHSGRVTMVLTLDKLNMSKRSIIRGLNWRTDTMVNYYMNTRSMCAKNAPSHRLSKLKAGQLSQLQKDLD